MMIIRVFPRKTKATPTDEDVRINCGPELWDDADEVDKEKHRKANDGWVHFQKIWIHPIMVGQKMREVLAA